MSLLLIAEAHPISCCTLVYQSLAEVDLDSIQVAYVSEFSFRVDRGPGFGEAFAWDNDFLSGYPCNVLRTSNSPTPRGRNHMPGLGITDLIDTINPQALLLNPLIYPCNSVAYSRSLRRGILV